MTSPSPDEVTQLLLDWSSGDKAALDKLMPLVYEELRRLAHHYMGRERPGHTLQTTAIVNEAYLQLINQRNVQWQNRAHFFGIAAHLSAEDRMPTPLSLDAPTWSWVSVLKEAPNAPAPLSRSPNC